MQPPAYARAFSFTDWTANNPSAPHPGVRLDVEYDALTTTTDAIRANLSLIQRDDGQLRNASVGADQLAADLTLGFRSVSGWTPMTDYVANDGVWNGGFLYLTNESHTSAASFATDLSAGRWTEIFDPSDLVAQSIQVGIAAGDIDILVDTSNFAGLGSTNAFTGANAFAGVTTFASAPIVAAGTATTAADYWSAKPTNYGAGKPGAFLRKKAASTAWELEIDDGAGGSGSLDIVVSAAAALTVNGVPLATQTSIYDLTTSVRRARNLALTS